MARLIFGKYEIQHRIAIGGMGEVFYALQRGVSGFARPVILKVLLPELADSKEQVDQFLDEARIAATLNHPNVVSIYEVGLWQGQFIIAMEYIRGRNLVQLQRRAHQLELRLPPQVSVRIAREAAQGLAHAHQARDERGQPLHIVHRDVSPQNIMLREDGVTKVVDFGIAKASNRASRTATGAIKGKLAYLAPEQVLEGRSGPAADQFALGVVFWELLTGERLFRADNDLAVLKLVLEREIPPPSRLRVDVPEAVSAVVMRMLARSEHDRFPTLVAAAEALEALGSTPNQVTTRFLSNLGSADLEPTPANAHGPEFVLQLRRPARRFSKLPVIAAAVSALAFGAMVVVRTTQRSEPGALVVPFDAGAPRVVLEPVPAPPRDEPLPPARPAATLRLTSTPSNAVVRIDGRVQGTTPQTLELDAASVHLLVSAPGYVSYEAELDLAPGETRPLELTLKPLAKPAARKETMGFVSINTTPWTKVALDGMPIGSTPISLHPVSAGSHRLTFVNEEEQIDTSRTFTVRAGQTVKLSLPMR